MEASWIDGASVWTVFTRIALPLTSPAIASVSIFNFLTAWEEYPWANTVINDTSKRTLPIAIAGFFGQHQFTQWGYVFAMSVLTLIPVVLMLTITEAAEYFGMGEKVLRKFAADHQEVSVRYGKRWRIIRQKMEDYLARVGLGEEGTKRELL